VVKAMTELPTFRFQAAQRLFGGKFGRLMTDPPRGGRRAICEADAKRS
jgi:hypothetical protein